MKGFYDELAELFSTIEENTGLEVCIYPSEASRNMHHGGTNRLPHSFFSHFGEFCITVKDNRLGKGCGGHDSNMLVKKSSGIGGPFVNVCHAGLSEVVFPIYAADQFHIATVFIGQVITEEVERLGFPEILRRVRKLGVDEKRLRRAYDKLPRMSKEQLLRIGKMADLAVKGLGSTLDIEVFEHQIMLNQYPAIRKALRLIAESKFTISEAEIADELKLHQSYFSRLFKKVMKCNFSTYVSKLRLNRAKVMLHHTEFPVCEIAERCGYSRQNYFTRQFKELIGMTPTEYRKNIR